MILTVPSNVLVTGVSGQCGATLAELLLQKGHTVYGTYRRLSTPNFWRLQSLGIYDKVKLIPADITDMSSLMDAIKLSQPDVIFNAAAQSFVGASFDSPLHSINTTGVSVANLLEALRKWDKDVKLVQFSTSEMYGAGRSGLLDEDSGFWPSSPYACAKLYGYHMIKNYREAYGMFCSNAIMFNSESPLRGLEFVTRKISNAVARISLGLQDKLHLGNLASVRDWTYCPDSMRGIYMISQHGVPDDFVIASGERYSVEDFVKSAFSRVGFDWRKHVVIDERFKRPLDVNYLCGDYTKAREILGWKPSVGFEELVHIMVDTDVSRWQRWKNGESFAWDGANYPEDIISDKLKLESA